MKQLIITALLIVAISPAFAQAQPPQPKQFQPDLNKKVTVSLVLPSVIFNDYLYSIQNPSFENSDLTGKQIIGIKRSAGILVDSIFVQYQRLLKNEHDTWAADTLKQFKNKKP